MYLRVFGHNITTIQQATSHVLSVARIALHHLVVRIKTRRCYFRDGQVLVASLGSRDEGSITDQGEVNTRVRHKISLEFIQIHIKGTVKAKRGGNGGDDLSNQSIEIAVRGLLDIQVTTANIVD